MPPKRIKVQKKVVRDSRGTPRVVVVAKTTDDGDLDLEELELSADELAAIDEEDENGHTVLKIKIPRVSGNDGGSDPLVRAAGVSGAIENLEAEVGALVQRARAQGYSWTQIGNALGTSKQAAWERFSDED